MPPWAARILLGHWGGSAVVATTTVLTSLLFSLVLALVGRQSGMGVRDTLTVMAGLMTGAFGADVRGSVRGVGADVGAFPLTITLLSLGLTVMVFRRVTAAYACASDAVVAAGRAALMSALAMMVAALVFTTRSDQTRVGASPAGAFFLTLIIVLMVLGLTVLMRRDWLRAGATRVVHDWVRAPLLGLVAMLLLLPVAGVVAALAVLLFGSGTSGYTTTLTGEQWRLIVVSAIAYAANIGLWTLTLGAGGKVGVFGLEQFLDLIQGISSSLGGDVEEIPLGGRLTWFTGTFHEPGLWVAVALTPLCLALAAVIVVRAAGFRARTDRTGPAALRGLTLWLVSLLLAVPFAVRLANVHTRIDGPLGISLSPTVGASGAGATFLLGAYALVAALVVALAAGALDRPTLRASIAAIGRRLPQQAAAASPRGPYSASGSRQPPPPPGARQPSYAPPPHAPPRRPGSVGPPPGPPPPGPPSRPAP